jgi:hypothetical protein
MLRQRQPHELQNLKTFCTTRLQQTTSNALPQDTQTYMPRSTSLTPPTPPTSHLSNDANEQQAVPEGNELTPQVTVPSGSEQDQQLPVPSDDEEERTITNCGNKQQTTWTPNDQQQDLPTTQDFENSPPQAQLNEEKEEPIAAVLISNKVRHALKEVIDLTEEYEETNEQSDEEEEEHFSIPMQDDPILADETSDAMDLSTAEETTNVLPLKGKCTAKQTT